MWPESIVEIEPTMPSGGNVVWEWHAWDHLVQNTDSGLANYGDPASHPRRIDVNYANVGGGGGPGGVNSGDWMHANAVNYHPQLDQITISSRRFSEVWIIDHGTTTEEAAGAAGDLLYRYGNPEAYGRGTAEERVLFGQHDVQWIPEGHPQAGQMMVYNNGTTALAACAPPSTLGHLPSRRTEPTTSLMRTPWALMASIGRIQNHQTSRFSAPTSVEFNPSTNGNHLICEGAVGHVFEVTLDGELVWDYINPEGNTGVFPQGTTPQQNSVFRAYRYGTSHPGLEDKVLIAGEPLQSGGGPP